MSNGLTVAISPTPQTKALLEQLRHVGGDIERAKAAAVPKATDAGIAKIARGLAAHLNIRLTDLRSWAKQVSNRREGIIILLHSPVPMLFYYTGSQRAKLLAALRSGAKIRRPPIGLSVRMRKRGSGKYPGGSEVIPGAFVAAMKSGHVGIFKRQGKGRYPIKELQGPTPLGVYLNATGDEGGETLRLETETLMFAELDKHLRSQISRFMAKARGT
jgi:hypothetical protein